MEPGKPHNDNDNGEMMVIQMSKKVGKHDI